MKYTPEELEARRVQFECLYEDVNGVVRGSSSLKREGETYTAYELAKAWQAYQWGLSAADRAQRAAPVGDAQHNWVRISNEKVEYP